MKVLNRIGSKKDNAYKYIFLLDNNLIVEATFIDKGDGKYIICMPNQTGCIMKCKFCFLTDLENIKTYNIGVGNLIHIVDIIINDLNIKEDIKTGKKSLLLSFMGSGEPLCNYRNILNAIWLIKNEYKNVRDAIATIMNDFKLFDRFSQMVKLLNLDVKVHLSMHYTDDRVREQWMPKAGNLYQSIYKLKQYEGKKEIHYTLIKDVNDTIEDINILIDEFKSNPDITIKFLRFNPKDSEDSIGTDENKIQEIVKYMKMNIVNEIEVYTPPAGDVGGSCGQFLLDYYKEYNI